MRPWVSTLLAFCLLLSWSHPAEVMAQPADIPVAQAPARETLPPARPVLKEQCGLSASQQQLQEVMTLLLERHIDDSLSAEMLYHAAIQGMLQRVSLERLDPNQTKSSDKESKENTRSSNYFLELSERQSMERVMQGTFLGVGLWLDTHEDAGYMDVTQVMRQSPAAQAGMRTGDRIVMVDGRRVGTLEKRDAMPRNPGSKVRFTVLRGVDRLEFDLVRKEFPLESVRGELLPPEIGLMDVGFLSRTSPQQARDVLQDLKERKIKGLVVDLRGSYGLEVTPLVQLLELFAPPRTPILNLEKREGGRQPILSKGELLLSVPTVVLVDAQTTGTAEALALALVELRGARLLGQQTAGRAVVEELFPLSDGRGVLISTTQLFAPSGRTWQSMGLLPEVPSITSEAERERAMKAQTVEEKLRFDAGLRVAVHLLTKW